jgi:hypothetical protein
MKLTSFLPVIEQYGLIEEVSENLTYYGFPLADALDPYCAIMKVETTAGVTTRKWTNGSMTQNVLWSDRAAVGTTYKFI